MNVCQNKQGMLLTGTGGRRDEPIHVFQLLLRKCSNTNSQRLFVISNSAQEYCLHDGTDVTNDSILQLSPVLSTCAEHHVDRTEGGGTWLCLVCRDTRVLLPYAQQHRHRLHVRAHCRLQLSSPCCVTCASTCCYHCIDIAPGSR